jgi:serine/threonine protein phosphatase PrpC
LLLKDENGTFIGPNRVWLKDKNIPGLAMSRSFGDKIGASVGIISEPEIIEYNINQDDLFFILASDGLWEFMDNNEVRYIIT